MVLENVALEIVRENALEKVSYNRANLYGNPCTKAAAGPYLCMYPIMYK